MCKPVTHIPDLRYKPWCRSKVLKHPPTQNTETWFWKLPIELRYLGLWCDDQEGIEPGSNMREGQKIQQGANMHEPTPPFTYTGKCQIFQKATNIKMLRKQQKDKTIKSSMTA